MSKEPIKTPEEEVVETPIPEEKAQLEKEKEIEELKTKLSNVTEEVIGMRDERRELRETNEELLAKLEKPVEPESKEEPTTAELIEQTVKKVLGNESLSRAKDNRAKALAEYVTEHKEFHPDNDPTGLKREALEERLKQFNTNGLESVEQFKKVMGDAGTLLGVNDTTSQNQESQNDSPSPVSTQSPNSIDTSGKLTPAEQRVIDTLGWTKERYLAKKAKDPQYVASLFD